jgi:hypothetical protein
LTIGWLTVTGVFPFATFFSCDGHIPGTAPRYEYDSYAEMKAALVDQPDIHFADLSGYDEQGQWSTNFASGGSCTRRALAGYEAHFVPNSQPDSPAPLAERWAYLMVYCIGKNQIDTNLSITSTREFTPNQDYFDINIWVVEEQRHLTSDYSDEVDVEKNGRILLPL